MQTCREEKQKKVTGEASQKTRQLGVKAAIITKTSHDVMHATNEEANKQPGHGDGCMSPRKRVTTRTHSVPSECRHVRATGRFPRADGNQKLLVAKNVDRKKDE